MAPHPSFPVYPHSVLLPDQRWFPAAEALRATAYEKLLPPLDRLGGLLGGGF